jgi:hypothetical protein
MTPDERAFRAHLEAGPFRAGVADSRWWLLAIDWPIAVIAVRAAHRQGAPDAFVMRFDLTNYPAIGPTAGPWDLVTGALMGEVGRPKGERVGKAFRTDWEDGRALYVACDRVALAGHEGWASQHRQWIWDDRKDISLYLRLLSEFLNDDDYLGV